MDLPVYTNLDDILNAMPSHQAQGQYLAMYSSLFSGITISPKLMCVPLDDHLVHRGDGVFEGFKMIAGKIYLLDAHLDRLARSAQTISLELRHPRSEIEQICKQLANTCQADDGLFRIYASRGPGGFSSSPYESIGPQMYIVLTALSQPKETLYENGVSAGFSEIAVKSGGMAQTKTCNYISNVLMDKEAVDRGIDFMINVTDSGFLGEGSRANIAYLTAEKDLVFSSFEHTLRGTTLLRVKELSHQLVNAGLIREMKEDKQLASLLASATEAMFIGTTIDALPITRLENKALGNGKPGPVAMAIRKMLVEDQIRGDASFSV